MKGSRIGIDEMRALMRRMLPALRRRARGTCDAGFLDGLAERSLPRLQAIAGAMPELSADSPFRFNLAAAGVMIAMDEAMEETGMSREEAREKLHAVASRYYLGMPRLFGFFLRGKLFSRRFHTRLSSHAAALDSRGSLAGDWRFAIEPGDGLAKPLRMDFTRCGIKVLCERLGRADLCPVLCSLDYAMAEAFGYDLERKGTLGEGKDRCDFVYRRRS